jgi:hypothetical protein
MADDLRCAECGGRGSETAVYTGEKIQMYTAEIRANVNKNYPEFSKEVALHPRCVHDWLATHQHLVLAAGPGAW